MILLAGDQITVPEVHGGQLDTPPLPFQKQQKEQHCCSRRGVLDRQSSTSRSFCQA